MAIKIPKNAFKQGQKKFKEGDSFNDVDLPVGTYAAQVQKVRTVETKNGPSAVVDLKVGGEDLDESLLGGRISVWFSFDEERIVWLFRFLALVGFEVDDLDQATMEEYFIDIGEDKPIVRVTAKKSGEYMNYRITKLLDDLDPEDIGLGSDSDEDEEEDEVDLDSMNRTELKAFIKSEKLSVRVKKTMSDEQLREAIEEAMEDEE